MGSGLGREQFSLTAHISTSQCLRVTRISSPTVGTSQQNHPVLPRPPLGRVRALAAPHARRARHRRPRRLRTRVRHAYQGADLRPFGPHCDRRRRPLPGVRAAGHHRQHELDSPTLGPRRGQDARHSHAVRALAIHQIEYSFASSSAGANNIKKWTCPEGAFVCNFSGHGAIMNTLAVNAEGFSGANNGSITLWDYNTGTSFQKMVDVPQPGSLEVEAGVFCSTFDMTGTGLIRRLRSTPIKRSRDWLSGICNFIRILSFGGGVPSVCIGLGPH
ncbi:hypothetical protein B0H14DRAFT_500534 [Mycena olivaceomarginata]|nr:hypothetical protein B0H14DRAFT_500534 [Mycena olivaceomarginata]